MKVKIVMKNGDVIITQTFESEIQNLCIGMCCSKFIFTEDCVLNTSQIVSVELL